MPEADIYRATAKGSIPILLVLFRFAISSVSPSTPCLSDGNTTSVTRRARLSGSLLSSVCSGLCYQNILLDRPLKQPRDHHFDQHGSDLSFPLTCQEVVHSFPFAWSNPRSCSPLGSAHVWIFEVPLTIMDSVLALLHQP